MATLINVQKEHDLIELACNDLEPKLLDKFDKFRKGHTKTVALPVSGKYDRVFAISRYGCFICSTIVTNI